MAFVCVDRRHVLHSSEALRRLWASPLTPHLLASLSASQSSGSEEVLGALERSLSRHSLAHSLTCSLALARSRLLKQRVLESVPEEVEARSQEPAASSSTRVQCGFTSPVADAMDWQRQETGNQPRHRALPRPRRRLRRPPGARTSGCAWCRDAPGAAWPVRIHTLWRACLAPRARRLTCGVCEMPHCGIACLIRFIQRARRAYGVHTACCISVHRKG
jgi:hypothetical protein